MSAFEQMDGDRLLRIETTRKPGMVIVTISEPSRTASVTIDLDDLLCQVALMAQAEFDSDECDAAVAALRCEVRP